MDLSGEQALGSGGICTLSSERQACLHPGLGQGEATISTSNTTHQSDTTSFLVCEVPQDRHHEPLSGKQPTNKKGEVTGSWS